jgi:hypothetical protein
VFKRVIYATRVWTWLGLADLLTSSFRVRWRGSWADQAGTGEAVDKLRPELDIYKITSMRSRKFHWQATRSPAPRNERSFQSRLKTKKRDILSRL